MIFELLTNNCEISYLQCSISQQLIQTDSDRFKELSTMLLLLHNHLVSDFSCSVHVISSDEDEPVVNNSGDVTVIPETQMEVDDFELVVSHRQKRFKLKLLRQQIEEITKDLGDNDSASDTSGNSCKCLNKHTSS